MSGAEAVAVVGTIASLINIIQGLRNTYDEANNVQGLHEAFRKVADNIPLVLSTLEEVATVQERAEAEYKMIKDVARKEAIVKDSKAIKQAMDDCKNDSEALQSIFETVMSSDGASWLERYAKAVQTGVRGRKRRVEELMRDILVKLQLLSSHHIFKTAGDNTALSVAIEQLSKLPPSLPVKSDSIYAQYVAGSLNVNSGSGEQPVNTQSYGSGNHQYNSGGGAMNFPTVYRTNDITWPAAKEPSLLPRRKASPRFIGYSRILRRLESRLTPKETGQSDSRQKVFVLSGVGGVGKSETVLQFVKQNRERFSSVFWIDCSSSELLRAGFKEIANRCGLSIKDGTAVIDDVVWYLTGLADYSLLVLDNCDDWERNYAEYIPDGERINVVITTRLPACEQHATYDNQMMPDREKLDGLDQESAIELVRLVLQRRSSREAFEESVKKMVRALEHHPLALIAGASFIGEGLCSLERYPTVFQEQKERLMKFSLKQMPSRCINVYATFDLSAQALEALSDLDARHALALLDVLAHMHYKNVSEDIFTRAWAYENRVVAAAKEDNDIRHLSQWHVVNSRSFLGLKSIEERTRAFQEARAWLFRLSLATLDEDTQAISMHSLAYSWARLRIEPDRRIQVCNTAAAILALSTEESRIYESFSVDLQRPIETSAALLISNDNFYAENNRKNLCRLLYTFAWQLYRVTSDETMSVVRKLKEESKRWLKWNEDAAQILEIQYLFGICLQQRGQNQEAKEVLQNVVKEQTAICSPKDTALLGSLHALAGACTATQDITEAIKLLKQALEAYQEMPDNHSIRLALYYELASACEANGMIAEAIDLLECTVEAQKELPNNHPDRLAAQQQLALAYQTNGQNIDAINLLNIVVETQQALPERHSDRFNSKLNLAAAYRANGQSPKAIELLKEVIEVQNELPESHPLRLLLHYKLAIDYRANGQITDAIKLLEQIVKAYKTFPENYPNRLVSQHELATAYQARGQNVEAIALLEKVVEVEKALPADNQDRLASEKTLAITYQANGQVTRAITLLEHIVGVQKTLPENHPHRISSLQQLIIAYRVNGQVAEAIELLEPIVQMYAAFPETHPDRIGSLQVLALAYQANGQFSEAVQLLEHSTNI